LAHLLRYREYWLTLNPQCSWSIIIGLVVVLLACGAAWLFSPKGETQTYALSSIIPIKGFPKP